MGDQQLSLFTSIGGPCWRVEIRQLGCGGFTVAEYSLTEARAAVLFEDLVCAAPRGGAVRLISPTGEITLEHVRGPRAKR